MHNLNSTDTVNQANLMLAISSLCATWSILDTVYLTLPYLRGGQVVTHAQH